MDLVENQPAGAESISIALWYFHCKLLINWSKNHFVSSFNWYSTKVVAYAIKNQLRNPIPRKGCLPVFKGAVHRALAVPWRDDLKFISLRSNQNYEPCGRTVIIFSFCICIDRPFSDSVLCQHCRHLSILTTRASMMCTRGVNGPRKCIQTSGWGGENTSMFVVSISKICFHNIKYKRFSCRKGFKRAWNVRVKTYW